MIKRLHLLKSAILSIALGISVQLSAEPVLKDGDLLAICGDSITEQRMYSVFIEDYLRMCQPTKVKVIQFGWSGEVAPNFANRMTWDVLQFNPTVATLLYGMNDGRYGPIDDTIQQTFQTSLQKIVDNFKAANVKVIVGTPGAVDPRTFTRADPTIYNQTLKALGESSKQVAESSGNIFADIHSLLAKATTDAEAGMDENYYVCGKDGYHPDSNGHLVMAFGFLKSMEIGGDIGTLEVDVRSATATASEGHKFVEAKGLSYTFESTRYPFCFFGEPKVPTATSGIINFIPFNETLNRFILKVDGPAVVYRITWGTITKEYSAEQLKQGINLASEFLTNPFSQPFADIEKKIKEKQYFETKYFKGLVHQLGEMKTQFGDDPSFASVVDVIKKRHSELSDQITEMIKPVTHTITIEPTVPVKINP